MRVTFTPHLVPLSHGELVSCYVTPAREVDAAALYRDAYADEPWVEVVEGPPGMHEVRETNFCRISVHDDPRTGRLIVFATIDNLYKGTSSQAVQNLNLMFGLDESLGLPGMTFSSRWVAAARPRHRGRAAGCRRASARRASRAGSSRPAASTSALLVSDAPDTVSAARFTRSGVLAAPVLLTQERCRLDAIRVVVANAGNANAATGRRGVEDAARMQGAASMAAGVRRGPGRGRLDRRDRRPARRRQGDQGHPRRARRPRALRRRHVRRGDPHDRQVRASPRRSRSRCRRAPCG